MYVDEKGEFCEHWYDDSSYWDNEKDEEVMRTDENPGPPPPRLLLPVCPSPDLFEPPDETSEDHRSCRVSLRGTTLQVITKLASIHLTPENPAYNGGSWHVEGMADENIVASGIYYFDSENISDSSLAFREAVEEPNYEQNDNEGVEGIYGLWGEGPLNQPRGTASTPQGRCLAWPNTLQHQVQPFRLLDKTKPGRRKILCFFLVDPNRRIHSTLDCPPQQAEWMIAELRMMPVLRRLPTFVFAEVCEFVVGISPLKRGKVPNAAPMGSGHFLWESDAKLVREVLMKERAKDVKEHGSTVFERPFSLCEH